jgi:predicted membrane GTPase involved in stress response
MEKEKQFHYSIDKLQDRGKFVEPNAEIYEGQVMVKTSW